MLCWSTDEAETGPQVNFQGACIPPLRFYDLVGGYACLYESFATACARQKLMASAVAWISLTSESAPALRYVVYGSFGYIMLYQLSNGMHVKMIIAEMRRHMVSHIPTSNSAKGAH